MGDQAFWRELKRRNGLRAVALYAGGVWAPSQGISQLTPAIGLPGVATRWFLIAAVIGFPFWIAFAWFYEWTPQGIKRDVEVAQGDTAGIGAKFSVATLLGGTMPRRGSEVHIFVSLIKAVDGSTQSRGGQFRGGVEGSAPDRKVLS